MDQNLCEYLLVRHRVDSKKTGREHRPEKLYKKWKRRWVVLSGNISPAKCSLNYCKKESDWLDRGEVTKCQLTNFSVEKLTGRGEHDNQLVVSLRTYAICLCFESVTKLDQWHKALERMLECYHVHVECPERRDFEGEHVIQFSLPGEFKGWEMSGRLQWTWSLQEVRRVNYRQSSDQLEIEVGRRSQTGEGKFIFTGQLVFRLFLVIKDVMKANRERAALAQGGTPPRKDTPPHAGRPAVKSPTHAEEFYRSVSGRSESSLSGASLGGLSVVSAPEMTPRRHPTTTRLSLTSASTPPSPTVVAKRHPFLLPGGSLLHSRSSLDFPQSSLNTGDYMSLRYCSSDNPASEYVGLCRETVTSPPPQDDSTLKRGSTPPTRPREGSISSGNTDDEEYINPRTFDGCSVPLGIEGGASTSLSLESEDSS